MGIEGMRITVVGLGYVGLVTSACLARLGHEVVGIEASTGRLEHLANGRVPFHEPGLDEAVAEGRASGRLRFVQEVDAVSQSQVTIVCVGTHDGNGGWQTETLQSALDDIVPRLADDSVLVVRSTMPPGFVAQVRSIARDLRESIGRPAVPVLVNPEFTKEGTALRDFLEPDRVVIGVIDDPAGRGQWHLERLYHPFGAPIVVMTGEDALLVKLASNLFLATKISFANELARLCETFGGDVERVVEGMSFDPRIGGSFLRAGVGFGGSCLPHQVTMVVRSAAEAGIDTPLLAAVDDINLRQRLDFVDRLSAFAGGLRDRRIGLLGLTFKPDTDDLRDAPSLDIASLLLESGATVVAYDPMPAAREHAAELVPGLRVVDSALEAVIAADAVGLVTEWPEFRRLDWALAATLMANPAVVDGRNALDRADMAAAGIRYVVFGRRLAVDEEAGETELAAKRRQLDELGRSAPRPAPAASVA